MNLLVEKVSIKKKSKNTYSSTIDLVAVEEPLEIILNYSNGTSVISAPLTMTMRSPGNDFELATGFLFSEGIINSFSDIEHIRYCDTTNNPKQKNTLKITLKPEINFSPTQNVRNFTSNSSCGICGKSFLTELLKNTSPIAFDLKIEADLPYKLVKQLDINQIAFKHTGGIHACGLFSYSGNLITIKEDIGRHNAFDKLIGSQIVKNKSFKNKIAVLSGRIGYEMVQKAAKAKIPIVIAIGAPTNLAIKIAKKTGICLIGFAKKDSFNIYSNSNYVNFLINKVI